MSNNKKITRDPNDPRPAEQVDQELDQLWVKLCEGNGTPEEYKQLEALQEESKEAHAAEGEQGEGEG